MHLGQFRHLRHTSMISLRSFRCYSASEVSQNTSNDHALPPCPPKRYAVIGGGFAGLAITYHLLQHATPQSPMHLDVYDAYDFGAGGSGAAAGLLHPYTPKGKILWRGIEAFLDALELIRAAEDASAADTSKDTNEPFVWRHGLLRVAHSLKQAKDFEKNVPKDLKAADIAGTQCLDTLSAIQNLVPGVADVPSINGGDSGRMKALYTKNGVVIHPARYLKAIWRACQRQAAVTDSILTFHPRTTIHSLTTLDGKQGQPRYSAIIVATGAAINSIEETAGILQLDLCQGYSISLHPEHGAAKHIEETSTTSSTAPYYPATAPSLLGAPYIALHGPNDGAVVGATQKHDISSDEAFNMLGPGATVEDWNVPEVAAAVDYLQQGAQRLWPPIGQWKLTNVRSGVRAIPQRTSLGAIPYAGKIPRGGVDEQSEATGGSSWWLICGLGARGLVYHAWIGKRIAEAVVNNSEKGLPSELLRWKHDGGSNTNM